MSNYTIELRFLENPPMSKLFDFQYDYYMKGLVNDEIYNQKKKEFENKFLEFYYFDEIGYKTPDRFKQRLKNYLDMGFKVWQERYKTELEVEKQKINFLLNKDLIEERITEGNATGNSSTTTTSTNNSNTTSTSTNNSNTTSTSTSNSNTTSTSTSNSNTTANNKNTVNDTPDTRFTSTENFATSITNDESSTQNTNSNAGETTNTNSDTGETTNTNTGTGETTNTNSGTGETINTSNQNSNVNERFTSKGNIGITSSAELLEKWREVIIDIDNEIIEGAEKFFMQIL